MGSGAVRNFLEASGELGAFEKSAKFVVCHKVNVTGRLRR
jgi:hypothetical protein